MERANPDDVRESREVIKKTVDIGLCAECVHHSIVSNKHESEFHLCLKNKSDSSFPKYPRLPVLNCKGYQSAKKDEPSH